MKTRETIANWLLPALSALLIWASPSTAVDSVQDTDLMVDPVIIVFPVIALGAYSEPAEFTITNQNAGETRTLGNLSLTGPNADQFVLANTCSGVTLLPKGGDGDKCTVAVKFHPTRRGTKGANLEITSNDAETPVLTAFVTNNEAAANECCRRMPPVVQTVDIPDTMQAGRKYILKWTQEGYDESCTSNIVLFDCTDIENGSCGNAYGDATRFAESGSIPPVSTSLLGNWQYRGVRTKLFNYEWEFNVPATRTGGGAWAGGAGTDVVVRFYRKNEVDIPRNSSSMSLLIPGNLSDEYYDDAGRRIVKKITQ